MCCVRVLEVSAPDGPLCDQGARAPVVCALGEVAREKLPPTCRERSRDLPIGRRNPLEVVGGERDGSAGSGREAEERNPDEDDENNDRDAKDDRLKRVGPSRLLCGWAIRSVSHGRLRV